MPAKGGRIVTCRRCASTSIAYAWRRKRDNTLAITMSCARCDAPLGDAPKTADNIMRAGPVPDDDRQGSLF